MYVLIFVESRVFFSTVCHMHMHMYVTKHAPQFRKFFKILIDRRVAKPHCYDVDKKVSVLVIIEPPPPTPYTHAHNLRGMIL